MTIRYSHNLQKLSAVYDEAPDRSGAPGAAAGAVAASAGSVTGAPARAATSPGAPGGGQTGYQNMPMYPGASVGLGGPNLQGSSSGASAGGISPELKAQQASSTAAYNKMFPTGHENFQGGMTQDQIEVKNKYLLANQMASGKVPQNMNLFDERSSGVGAGIWDFAKNIPGVGEAGAIYDTAKGMYDGKSFGSAVTDANRTYTDDKRVYGDMLLDEGRRIGNRYGGEFDLHYKNDKLLDYGSHALEQGIIGAIPVGRIASLGAKGVGLAAGGVAKGVASTGISKLVGVGKMLGQTAVEAAPALGKAVQYARTGLQAAAPYAAQAAGRVSSAARAAGNFARYGFKPAEGASRATRYAANLGNSALVAVNAFPAVTKMLTTAPGTAIGFKSLATAGLGQYMASQAMQAFGRNLSNAVRDVAAYREDHPDAGLASSLYQGGKSMLSNVGADLTGGNRFGLGAGLFTSPLADAYNAKKEIDYNTQLNNLSQAGLADTVEGAEARTAYADLVSTPGALDKARAHHSAYSASKNPYSSQNATANRFIAPSVKDTFGMLGYREQRDLDKSQEDFKSYNNEYVAAVNEGKDNEALQSSTNDYLAAVGEGRDPNTDPKVQALLANASPKARANMHSHMAATLGESFSQVTGGMPMDELEAAINDPSNFDAVMNSPLGSLAGGDPKKAQLAGSLMYGARSALSMLQAGMANGGPVSPEFTAITKAFYDMNNSFQNEKQKPGEMHPGLVGFESIEPILMKVFAEHNAPDEVTNAAPVANGQPVG